MLYQRSVPFFPEVACGSDGQTSLASRAIDGLGDSKIREGVIDSLMRYLETDTIL